MSDIEDDLSSGSWEGDELAEAALPAFRSAMSANSAAASRPGSARPESAALAYSAGSGSSKSQESPRASSRPESASVRRAEYVPQSPLHHAHRKHQAPRSGALPPRWSPGRPSSAARAPRMKGSAVVRAAAAQHGSGDHHRLLSDSDDLDSTVDEVAGAEGGRDLIRDSTGAHLPHNKQHCLEEDPAVRVSVQAEMVRESATLLEVLSEEQRRRAPAVDPRAGLALSVEDPLGGPGQHQQQQQRPRAAALPDSPGAATVPGLDSPVARELAGARELPVGEDSSVHREDEGLEGLQATFSFEQYVGEEDFDFPASPIAHGALRGSTQRGSEGPGGGGRGSVGLSQEEIDFLADVLGDEGPDEPAPPSSSSSGSSSRRGRRRVRGGEEGSEDDGELLRMSMAAGNFGATVWRDSGVPAVAAPATRFDEDPPPGALNRMLHREIQAELRQDHLVDFTRLSLCSRSEATAEAHHPGAAADVDHMAELKGSLTKLQAAVARAEERGQLEKAVGLREDSLGLLMQLEGPDGNGTLELCEQLVRDYNALGLRLLEGGEYEGSYEMLKKAELLTEPSSNLCSRPIARVKLRAITFNNLGCYYKQRGKLHAALHYLERTVKIEESAAMGAVENPASTHLNIAATLSTLGRHSTAVDYADQAVEFIRQELALEGDDLLADVEALLEERAGNKPVLAKLSILAVGLYNKAVELEHLGQNSRALGAYEAAKGVAKLSDGPKSQTAIMLGKAERAFRHKVGSRRRLSSAQTLEGVAAGNEGGARSSSGGARKPRPESAPTRRRASTSSSSSSSKAPPPGQQDEAPEANRRQYSRSSTGAARADYTGSGSGSGGGIRPPSSSTGRRDSSTAAPQPLIQRSSSMTAAAASTQPYRGSGPSRDGAAAASSRPGSASTRKRQQTGGRTHQPRAGAADGSEAVEAPAAAGSVTVVRVALRLRRVDAKDLGPGKCLDGRVYRNGMLLQAAAAGVAQSPRRPSSGAI